MKSQPTECDDSRLAILLSGSERSDDYRRMASHVEHCAHCRDQLTALAADRQTWEDVTTLLTDFDATADADGNELASLLSLNFLAPPSHPEMLGRLGRYEIEKVIGSGGMGVVLKAHDTELNRPVAIKVMAPFLAHSGAARQRFAREGRAAAAVVHEHVVAIHNVETNAELPYLVMQYVPGQSLQTRVEVHGPLAIKEILRIGIQATAGLAAAHAQGVVHRDIKPSNIMLENGVERALLTDFGLARAADDASLTRTGIVAGTPHYMSPEQASGNAVDHRSDLFSLGALLYFMCTGHPPFRAEQAMAVLHRICHDRHRPVWEINPDVPDELSRIIDRLLEKKPARRFASAEQAGGALLGLLEKLQRPGRVGGRSTIRRWLRNRKRWVVGSAMAAVGIAAAVGMNGVVEFGSIGEIRSPIAGFDSSTNLARDDLSTALADVLALGVIPTQEFDSEIVAVESELRHVEAANSERASFFMHSELDHQHAELAALLLRLSQMEEPQFLSPLSQGER